jgi:hypothetical protein
MAVSIGGRVLLDETLNQFPGVFGANHLQHGR